MRELTPESIPYGVSKFEELRKEGRYFVNKSEYIHLLEQRADFLFFVRPRRFGKSLFGDMLRCYYDCNKKNVFDQLAGYARSPNLEHLAAGTPVHFLDVEFVGRDLLVCELPPPHQVKASVRSVSSVSIGRRRQDR